MTLVKYSDLDDYRPVSFSSLIDRVFNDSVAGGVAKFRPSVDIIEGEKSFEVQFAVPGMKKEDFTIDVEEGRLVVSGERKIEKEEEGKNYHTRETQYGSFSRSFRLPELVDTTKINASYNDGILTVDIPKDEKKAQKTVIKVK